MAAAMTATSPATPPAMEPIPPPLLKSDPPLPEPGALDGSMLDAMEDVDNNDIGPALVPRGNPEDNWDAGASGFGESHLPLRN